MLTHLFLNMTLMGAEWVLWVLILLSFLSVGIVVDRFLYFQRQHVDGAALAENLSQNLRAGNLQAAWELVANGDNIESQVVAAGLASAKKGAQACSEAMLSVKAREKGNVDSKLSILGTIGSNAPFVGLLGTVLGIIKAAHDMGAQSGGSGDPGAVMAGVFEALVATAVGLCVAIPAIVFFNSFQRKVKATMSQVDSLAHLVLTFVPAQKTTSAAQHSQAAGV
jgi:biopolymer transport protein ExbB